MKNTMKSLTAGAIAIALLAPAAFAEPGDGDKKGKGRPGGDRPHGDRPSREEIMKKFDKDKDGKLSEDERVTMIRARMEKSEKFKEMFTKRADKNTDGELTDDEIKAARTSFGDRRTRGPGGKKPAGDDAAKTDA